MKYIKSFNESNSESGVKDITNQVDVKLLTTLDDERESVKIGDVVIITYFMGGFKTYEFEVKFIEPRSPHRQDLEAIGNSDEYSDYDLENAYHVVTKDTYLDFLNPMNESKYWFQDYIKGVKEAYFSKEDIEDLLSEFNDAPRTSEEPGFIVRVQEQSPIKWSNNETEEQMMSTARQIIRYGYIYKYIVEIDSFSEGRQDNYHWRYDYHDQSKLTEYMIKSLWRLVSNLKERGWEYSCKVAFAKVPDDPHVERPRDMVIKDGWLEPKLLQDKSLYRLEPGDGVFHIGLELIRWSTDEKSKTKTF